ncbi:DUF1501 domain-containing protein [Pirellulaceae bacterium]|nr:DUF1501 domain-containing protein [Pirellulaceae bacterium]
MTTLVPHIVMLSFSNPLQSRRSFLTVGSLGLGGLCLPDLLKARARLGAQESDFSTDKSVILLFLHGGPSQTETFDPKMEAPAGIRSVTGEVQTKLPGVTFGSSFPKLAQMADRLAIIRSFASGNGNHDIKPVVDSTTFGANLGSVYARVAGANDPQSGIPKNVALFPRSVDESTQKRTSQFGKFESTGSLGKAYAPFIPGAGGPAQEDMKLQLAADRLDDRKSLLTQLDQYKRQLDSLAGQDKVRDQAFSAILGGVANAFDLTKEDPETVARYDTAPLVRPDAISRKWNNYNNYVDNAKSLGKLLLLARRLCEQGCGFVTVSTNFVWDMHADVNNATMTEGMSYMGPPLDHAVSAFLEDTRSRGLDEKIMLVATGEMGRTPKINAKGGRDHWGGITPLLLSGGGINTGQVIGQSTKDGGRPASSPFGNSHLIATILHTLLDVGELRTVTGLPSDVSQILSRYQPINGLH